MRFLALEGAERTIARLVLQEAINQQHERDAEFMRAMEVAVQRGVARAFSR